ncbi:MULTISPECIES: glycoside hydrolase family 15 protein [unclassified Arthrobacter]|uniref:glycoside hydrolase family 15 protein n=1 Tax=unclassified Arthrobacter TaxID=235627 RepID=UPI00159D14BF|nr:MULTISPECIES: glycoside hydrolase family 15 protein [unclassified Arthrobacter]MCQ9165987.1 glycoside hydrolase family 15 protein [Arthrobacter sp. STN4]NVM98697.1 glycoside hydrolase family 15 protein [Arthrobacter sp. SDTb3-6]
MLHDSNEPFPPHVLREYAMLADGERGALLGPRGDVVWMCAPRWHSGAVFSALIGGPGVFGVTPTDLHSVWGGSYEDGTLIWNSRWTTNAGQIGCREALMYPGEPERAVILRRIRGVAGPARVRVVLDARANFGRHRMTRLSLSEGVWTARSGDLRIRLTGAAGARIDDGVLSMEVDVEEGAEHDLVLEVSSVRLPRTPPDPDASWIATEEAWRKAVPGMGNTIAPDDARQSYAVLRGMTGADGAMVAAATMGLPERANANRNYDYRYAWIRDQCFAGEAAAACGALDLLDDAVRFVTGRLLADGPRMKPAYTVDCGRVPDEVELGLPGYPGGSSKVGNWVNKQFQLDAFGECLLLFAAAAGLDRLELDHWRAVETCIAAIEERWREPDAGIWELDNRRWAHSRLICVAGLRAIARHAPAAQGSQWAVLADVIAADVSEDCLHPTGRWQRAPGDERVDGSLLMPIVRGALTPDDVRSAVTLSAIHRELGRQGFLYRFSQDARPLADAEGAFLLCGFTMATALHLHGEEKEAVRWFERNRAACGSPGLFTEEYDIEQRQLRGNFPQGFVHAAMLEASRRLAEPGGGHAPIDI